MSVSHQMLLNCAATLTRETEKANKFAKKTNSTHANVFTAELYKRGGGGGARPKKPSSASYFPEISNHITKLEAVSGKKMSYLLTRGLLLARLGQGRRAAPAASAASALASRLSPPDPTPNRRGLKTSSILSAKSDFYKVLGVPRDADAKAIKRAYYQLAKRYCHDKTRLCETGTLARHGFLDNFLMLQDSQISWREIYMMIEYI